MDPAVLVGLAHTAERRLADEEVLALVRKALEPLGGMSAFVHRGDRVVLKPNQTVWFLAEDGVTTDPRVVAALVTLCREAGAGSVAVGDGSGGDARSAHVLEVTGMKRLALAAGADEVVGFEDEPHVDVPLDLGRGRAMTLPVPRRLLEADVVINVPKAKTHFEDLITCCIKNWVGVPHQASRPQMMHEDLLPAAAAALHRAVPAALHVVDGLWAGEGPGPTANRPVWLGCVVAGTDPVAVDSVVARLMGFDPAGLKFAGAGEALGLGTRDPGRIRVAGGEVETLAIHAAPTPPGVDYLPCRVLIGEGVDWAGSLGHFKSIGDTFERYGLWGPVLKLYGRPTFMIGRVEDPDFEAHLEEGPYFVIDDAALDKYRTDRRVTTVPGHPATHNIFPHIFSRLRVPRAGPAAFRVLQGMLQAKGYFHHRGWKAGPGDGGPEDLPEDAAEEHAPGAAGPR